MIYEAWRQQDLPEGSRRLFCPEAARQECHGGVLWREISFQHQVDLLADRHLEVQARRHGPYCCGRKPAFNHLTDVPGCVLR